MNAAIFYSGTYGSTAQYANWIGDATGLPVFSIDLNADPAAYDVLVLGNRKCIAAGLHDHPAGSSLPQESTEATGRPATLLDNLTRAPNADLRFPSAQIDRNMLHGRLLCLRL